MALPPEMAGQPRKASSAKSRLNPNWANSQLEEPESRHSAQGREIYRRYSASRSLRASPHKAPAAAQPCRALDSTANSAQHTAAPRRPPTTRPTSALRRDVSASSSSLQFRRSVRPSVSTSRIQIGVIDANRCEAVCSSAPPDGECTPAFAIVSHHDASRTYHSFLVDPRRRLLHHASHQKRRTCMRVRRPAHVQGRSRRAL